MIQFELLHPKMTTAMLGYLPSFINKHDPRGAVEQIDTAYQQQGGWRDFEGFRFNKKAMTLTYPGDPPVHALAKSELRDETLILFEHDWFMVLQKDGSHRIARLS